LAATGCRIARLRGHSWRLSIVFTRPAQFFLSAPALGLALAMGAVPALAESVDTRSIIAVTASGKTSVAPDIAFLNLSVLRDAPTARDALTANNAAMAEVLAAMKAFGIEDRDLQTTGFSINPVYVYPKADEPQTPPKITGYQVQNGLSVRVRDLAKLGEVLDEAVSLGVNSGGQVSFGNDNPDEALQAARVSAMKNAVAKANVLVEAAGAKLGKIVSISESFDQPYPQPIMAKAMMADAMAAPESVPMASGENTYSITVSVQFEIAQ
jgi:uncharacterized protein YggE